MSRRQENRHGYRSLTTGFFFLLVGLFVIAPRTASAQGVLENPQPGSFQSGIGVISGWVCTANRVDIELDGSVTLQAAYGTSRDDTRSACGDDGNNGFGLLFNWNLLDNGLHFIRAVADGTEIGRASVIVATLGEEFLQGASGEFTLTGFPQADRNTQILWQESNQNFIVRSATAAASGGNPGGSTGLLENPQAGSFQSGVGIVSGWVCTADRVDIEIDGTLTLQAAYGTSRNDTQDECGDDGNNGFGLLFNWNLLGDGDHTVRALRNGTDEIGQATFTVATLGLGEFAQGLSGAFNLENFPSTGMQTRLQWQESLQNFVLTGEVLPGTDQTVLTTQTQTVEDGDGGSASVSVTNPGVSDGKTMLLQVQALLIGAQTRAQDDSQRAQSAPRPFRACLDRLEFLQNNTRFTSNDFDWKDTLGERVCQDVQPGSSLMTVIAVARQSGLNFNRPFQIFYAGNSVLEFPPRTGGQQPQLIVGPRTLGFGPVAVGSTADASFTVANGGGGMLSGNITTSAPFSIVSGGSFNLAPGVNQMVTVRFSPTMAGTFSGSVNVTSNGGNADVNLLGAATTAQPALSASPTSLNFGTVAVSKTVEMSFTVTNSGSGILVGRVDTTPPFGIASGGSFTLEAGASQEITINFSPKAAATFTDSANITSNGGDAEVSLSGSAIIDCSQLPPLAGSPTPLPFGNVQVGQQRCTDTFSDGDLTISATVPFMGTVNLAPGTSSAFSIVSGEGAFNLPSGGTQSIRICFMPPAPGLFTGIVNIETSIGCGVANLRGTGM